MRDRILYIGRFALPDRDAAAVRVSGVADALTAAGYAVDLIGDEMGTGSASARQAGKSGIRMRKVLRGLDYLLAGGNRIWPVDNVDWSRMAAVICYPGSASFVLRMLLACRKHRVPLILDVVEWYNPSHTPFGRFGPFALDSEIRMRWIQQRAGNLICISSFLARYYAARGCRVLRVPTLIGNRAPDNPPAPERDPDTRPLRLIYAGSPGRKECFPAIISGVQGARRRGVDVLFRIVGATESQIASLLRENGHSLNMDGVECCGRVPRDAALSMIASSDFSMIVRPQDRFANAGFPTKFVESLSLGVPVMANGTSDIAEFLRDGRDGYLLYEPTAAAVEHAIMRAWQRTTDEKMQMRSAAWMRSRECFDYRRHAAELAEFVQGAQSCA